MTKTKRKTERQRAAKEITAVKAMLRRTEADTENLFSRLANYKFEQALQYLKGQSKITVELVTYLSKQYGNCGWIMGEVAILINAALNSIPGYSEWIESQK